MCENELYYILIHCKRLVSLNLSKTRFDRRCYCENHDPCVKFDSTVIKSLLVRINRGVTRILRCTQLFEFCVFEISIAIRLYFFYLPKYEKIVENA